MKSMVCGVHPHPAMTNELSFVPAALLSGSPLGAPLG